MNTKKLAVEGGKPFVNKKFDLGATYFKEEKEAVAQVIDSGIISGFVANSGPKFYGGQKVLELESSFKDFFNTEYAVASNSATSSLHCALAALGIGYGDEVIVPSVSMSASASSILMVGAKPVFIDINNGFCETCECSTGKLGKKGCFNIDVSKIEENLTKRTKAILVVHLFGKSADMEAIMNIAKTNDLYVIEDCAQSPGTKFKGKYVGTLGDIGVFSFNQSKTISSGEGGVAITNNKMIALRMQLMRNHGEAMIEDFPDSEWEDLIGFNYRITDLEAAVALEQFKKLDKFNSKKVELANAFSKRLEEISGLQGLDFINPSENAVFIYPLIFNQQKFKVSRNEFVELCISEGIPMVSGYTKPLTDLPLFKPFCKEKVYKIADNLFEESLITTKVCHHHNVDLSDIDLLSNAIEYVVSKTQK